MKSWEWVLSSVHGSTAGTWSLGSNLLLADRAITTRPGKPILIRPLILKNRASPLKVAGSDAALSCRSMTGSEKVAQAPRLRVYGSRRHRSL